MIISLSGLSGSGKDMLASSLIKKHGFQRVAMADILKEVCSNITGLPLTFFHDVNLKDAPLSKSLVFDNHLAANLAFELNALGIDVVPAKFEPKLGETLETPRSILVFIGTHVCRNLISQSIWLDLTMNKIRKMEGNIIITDARFQNERDAIKGLGGIKMFIDRPSVTNKFNPQTADISELDQLNDSYDVQILNNSTKELLELEIDLWYNSKAKLLR